MSSAASRGRAVLLHGQPGTGVGWRAVAAALGETVDVIAPDRPGYGRNPHPPGGVAHNADWLANLVDDADATVPTVVVAHSWAGGVALELAARRPQWLHGLVLVSSVGPGAVTRIDHLLARPVVGPAAARVAFGPLDPVVRWRLRRADGAGRVELNGQRLWQTFLVEQRSLVSDLPAVLSGLEAIETPTAVLAGTRDRVVPFATARALANRLPNAALEPLPRGGHALHRSHPGAIADAVRRVFADARRP